MNHDKRLILKRLTAELLTGTLLGLALLAPARAQEAADIPDTSNLYATDRLVSSHDITSLLPLVLTSRERRELAEKLEASMRKGDLNEAQSNLNSAIEVGTLAIVLAGQLKNPDLLKTLQDLGIKGDIATPVEAAGTSETCSAPVALADLQEAIEREQNYSGMISQTLNDLMQENNALKARLDADKATQEAQLSEMRQALKQEHDKSEAASRDLANLRDEHEALQSEQTAAAASTTEWEARLREERELRNKTARQLAEVETELSALHALKEQESVSQSAHVSELEKTLARTQAQSEVLAQELVAVNKELSALKELRQSSVTPLVHRITEAGMDMPLPQAGENTQPQETAATPHVDEVASPSNDASAPQKDVTVQKKDPAPVVIASLPASLGSLPSVAAAAEQPKADDRLTSRADELLRKGDVSGARLLLERALDSRNARAAFLMGETFDPNVLNRLRVLGIRGDASKAREFYGQALALGMSEARTRMEALK